jgi:hypothetical protein
MNEHDEPLCHSDAAYILGALSPADRRHFEEHLAECPDCQQSVGRMAGLPGLLARVSPEDLDPPPPLPSTLLPGLVTAQRRGQTRRRVAMGLIGAAAAVVLLFALQGGPSTGAEHPLAMHAVVASPVSATVSLDDRAWGTQIQLRCTYQEKDDATKPPSYRLVATDHTGSTRQVATWQVVPGKVSTITGSVDWSASDIASLSLETSGGTELLDLAP